MDNLLDRLREDEEFNNLDLDALMDPSAFIGRAPEQVDEFLRKVVEPINDAYQGRGPAESELRV